ncbi:sodium:solute symporter family protein [Fusibacter ferrireducens]|uniref:Sodium:solute symporter family protein n=1 Tax=Fusibacter ferrireducens TaxID=2785058 RepID=A0ABR9ZR46_9FIRM|nr:sodium:solute symporter family protein [Fusibacter ferrireducens]MBF4692415.1 sodium:solute symporter family protein [Fusibacter ferrireducens]
MIIFSATITLLVTALLGYLSKFKIKSSNDFITAGSGVGTFAATGSLMGAIIGGASTVGTAQLAYTRGYAAIWFILGLCTASILLSFVYGKLIEEKKVETLPQILEMGFGKKASVVAGIALSFGMFIHINGQVLACNALFSTVFNMQGLLVTIMVVVLLIAYVIFGGFWGGAMVGTLKMFLLYGTSMIAGGYILFKLNGISGIRHTLTDAYWYNLFNGGGISDLGAYLSTVVGVLATQNYFQTVMASKNKKVAYASGVITAALVLPIGIVCTLVGMFMRVNQPDIVPANAFPLFVVTYLPKTLAGITLATILISSLATAAGLTLGISTIFTRDLYKKGFCKTASDGQQMRFMRIVILLIGVLTVMITTLSKDSMILNFGFMSMMFRAVPIFIPVMVALYFNDRINPKVGVFAIALSPLASLLWIVLGFPMQTAVYIGMLISIIIFIFYGKIKSTNND